ncbi:MAG TPA: ABC transporter substrate-binding protein, partial [Acidimicrobiales bacterium]|nr:ABC transporter substrate-binding protein [Acidimicrobiales bacterium]
EPADRYGRRTFLTRGARTAAAVGLAGVGAPAILEGCGTSTGATVATPGVSSLKPRSGGTVTIGVNSEINGFLPSTSHWDNTGLTYANTVFDSLTQVAADGTAKPYLAQAVTPNPDKTVWTITLRPNVMFHDGSPLNADVIVANFEALRASPLTAQAVTPISGVAATGPLEVTVTCKEPLVAFPHYLATQVGYPVALAQLEKNDTQHPIGTGPFSIVSWEPNDHFTVQRNPHYWRNNLPYLDSITFKPIASDNSREASLRSGTIDLMLTRDPHAIQGLRNNPGFQQIADLHRSVGQTDSDFIILNCAAEPTNDITVRQAMAYALNVDELVRLFGAGVTTPNLSLFPPGSPYRPSDNGYPTYDLNKAKQLVAQAAPNHGGAIKLTLATITDPRLLTQIQAVSNMWELAGMQVSVNTVLQVEFIDNLVTGAFQAYTDEMFGASDPDLNYVWLSSTTAGGPGSIALNFARNKDDVLEAALQEGRTQSDPAARAAAYQTVDKQLAKDLPYLWVSRATWSLTGSNAVMNFDNLTLPDGSRAQGFAGGIFTPTPMWRRA